MALSQGLELAYRYPFLREAKEAIAIIDTTIVELRFLDAAKEHLRQAGAGKLSYVSIRLDSARRDYLLTYLYSRMLVSAIGRLDLVQGYVASEGARSLQALSSADLDEVIMVGGALGIRLTGTFPSGTQKVTELTMGFADYLRFAPEGNEYELANQRLSRGIVTLGKANAARVVCEAAKREMMKGLPIDRKELPAKLLEYARGVHFAQKGDAGETRRAEGRTWIDRLMETPIPDVRHRTVNLILAPYLVNTRNMPVEEAVKAIEEYVNRCRQVNPNTNVNETYIRYQCNYAKRRGLKPLSYARAKELIGEFLDPTAGSGGKPSNG